MSDIHELNLLDAAAALQQGDLSARMLATSKVGIFPGCVLICG
jgi:hypothetical protein